MNSDLIEFCFLFIVLSAVAGLIVTAFIFGYGISHRINDWIDDFMEDRRMKKECRMPTLILSTTGDPISMAEHEKFWG